MAEGPSPEVVAWSRAELSGGSLPRAVIANLRNRGYSQSQAQDAVKTALMDGLRGFARVRRSAGTPEQDIVRDLEKRGLTPFHAKLVVNRVGRRMKGETDVAEKKSSQGVRTTVKVIGIVIAAYLLLVVGVVAAVEFLPGRAATHPGVAITLGVVIATVLHLIAKTLKSTGVMARRHQGVVLGVVGLLVLGGLVWLYTVSSRRVQGTLETMFTVACVLLVAFWVLKGLAIASKNAQSDALRAQVWAEKEREAIRRQAREEFIRDYREMREAERQVENEFGLESDDDLR